ncbi:TPA: HEAT repeat domain-containing protein [Candidatus Poribacteria bacterium]|jgi:HEAT repeat protein|nr:HEAT repeat domain-containing protein [Candidatus Poribacteria bacterium]
MIQAIWYYQSTLTVCAKMREGEGAIDAVPALIQALKDRDEYVRDYVTGALGEIGTPEALKAVEEYQSP